MAYPTTVPGDLIVPGLLWLNGAITPTKIRSDVLSLNDLQPFLIPWTAWRVWDALQTNLPGTAANDDLGLICTSVSMSPSIQTGDLKAAGATTRYARAQIALPWEYEAGEGVTFRFHAGMITNVASSSATIDLQCYQSDEEVGVSADLCDTAAQSMNSLVFADLDFVITPSTLSPGDLLDFRIAIAVNDGATGTAVIGCVGAAKLLCDVR